MNPTATTALIALGGLFAGGVVGGLVLKTTNSPKAVLAYGVGAAVAGGILLTRGNAPLGVGLLAASAVPLYNGTLSQLPQLTPGG